MTAKTNPHAVEIVRDETWPLNEGVAAYTWECDCGDTSPRFYATDLYGDELQGEQAEDRARAAAEIDSLDHTEDEWELSR
jgi:hypothetical protein